MRLEGINTFELLVLGYKDTVIGKLSHDNGVSSEYYRGLDPDMKITLALDTMPTGKVVHVDYVVIDPELRGRGHFEECIKEFERFAISRKFKMITIFTDKEFVRKYEKLGYSAVLYEATFDHFLMLKKLT